MKHLAMLLALTLGAASAAAAQSVTPGDEVRLKGAASGRFTVMRLAPDVITVSDSSGNVVDVPLESIRRLDVFRGQRSAGRGFLRGAGIVGGAGAVAGVVIGFASGDDEPGILSFSAEDKALILGVFLGGTGAIVGGIIGMVAPGEQWERVDMNVPVAVGLGGNGVHVGYVHRF